MCRPLFKKVWRKKINFHINMRMETLILRDQIIQSLLGES